MILVVQKIIIFSNELKKMCKHNNYTKAVAVTDSGSNIPLQYLRMHAMYMYVLESLSITFGGLCFALTKADLQGVSTYDLSTIEEHSCPKFFHVSLCAFKNERLFLVILIKLFPISLNYFKVILSLSIFIVNKPRRCRLSRYTS